MSGINVSFKAEYKSHEAERMKELVDKIQKGLQKAVLVVERQAKEDCPVDTGRLRASITSEVSGDEGKVGTNVEYAADVEFGTVRQSAQPFLFPALEKNRDKIKELIGGA